MPASLLLRLFFFAVALGWSPPLPSQEMTTDPLELNEAGEPLKPNERRIPREQFGPELEQYWGIRLSEIDDEFIRQKGDETLFIDAGGQIFIKTKAPWYPGETGKSYASTEEMLRAEGRWDELREYLRKVGERLQPFIAAPTEGDPRIVLIPDWTDVAPGHEITIRLSTAGVPQEKVQIAGIVLKFDPGVLKFLQAIPAEGARMLDEEVRERSPSSSVLRLRVKRGPGEATRSGTLALLRFRAVAPGDCLLEPLSVEATADRGTTYLQIENDVKRPKISEVRIRAR